MDYILSLADGTVVDSTESSGLWTYVHGQTKLPPGLEKGLEGLGIGDHTRVELGAEDAFGLLDPAAFQDVPKTIVPTTALQVGLSGELPGPGGTVIPFQIHAIHEDTVTLNLNHPLAGQRVIFEVWIRHIQD
jgi:FKBP-type peptidyl-prolyl cis-trans isomerase 2